MNYFFVMALRDHERTKYPHRAVLHHIWKAILAIGRDRLPEVVRAGECFKAALSLELYRLLITPSAPKYSIFRWQSPRAFVFGYWNFYGAWCLMFGVSAPMRSTEVKNLLRCLLKASNP